MISALFRDAEQKAAVLRAQQEGSLEAMFVSAIASALRNREQRVLESELADQYAMADVENRPRPFCVRLEG